jgi:hypothetical protein
MIVLPSYISNHQILKQTYYTNYNYNNLLYYVTEPCYNENSQLNLFKMQFLLIDTSINLLPI